MAPSSKTPSDNPSSLSHKILVALATYNECENIGRLYPAIRAILPNADILVIDDNSPDGTGNKVSALSQADPMLHLI
ncbi:MAG: glycosyltransferase, partial [Gemmataceae bacterium]